MALDEVEKIPIFEHCDVSELEDDELAVLVPDLEQRLVQAWIGKKQIFIDEVARHVVLLPFDQFAPKTETFPDAEFLEQFELFQLTELEVFMEPFVESCEMILSQAPKRDAFFADGEVSAFVNLRVRNFASIVK